MRRRGLRGPWEVFSSVLGSARRDRSVRPRGRRRAVHRAGVRRGSGLGRRAFRARTIAAVNILNAAFMTGATVLVAVMQSLARRCRCCSSLLGVLDLAVAAAIWRTMPRG